MEVSESEVPEKPSIASAEGFSVVHECHALTSSEALTRERVGYTPLCLAPCSAVLKISGWVSFRWDTCWLMDFGRKVEGGNEPKLLPPLTESDVRESLERRESVLGFRERSTTWILSKPSC